MGKTAVRCASCDALNPPWITACECCGRAMGSIPRSRWLVLAVCLLLAGLLPAMVPALRHAPPPAKESGPPENRPVPASRLPAVPQLQQASRHHHHHEHHPLTPLMVAAYHGEAGEM